MKIVRWQVVVALATCAALTPSTSESQQVWGTVRLPGGAAAARRVADLGADEGRLGASVLLDFVRRYFASPQSSPAVGSFTDYLRYMTDLDVAARSWPEGCVLPASSASRAERARLESYLELLGLTLRERQGRLSVALDESDTSEVRQRWLDVVGLDAARLGDELNAGRAIRLSVPFDELPLPLPAYWAELARTHRQSVMNEVVRDAANAYLYHGLFAMDRETLAFFGSRPAMLQEIAARHGAAFATFARSLRVRVNVIDLPGGRSATAVWKSLVGRGPDEPERFLPALLGTDRGRLAFFYDAVDQLDRRRQDFALGGQLEGAQRVAFVASVYAPFAALETSWSVTLRPFSRPIFDPSLVLRLIDVEPGGVAGPAWWPSVLQRAGERGNWPTDPGRTMRAIRPRPLNAAWLLSWIFESPVEARSRFQAFRFVQRNFPDAGLADAPSVEIALRTSHDMPALAASLERMGVRDPALFARVAWSARRLTMSGGRTVALPVIGRWQGAVGLLEQIHRRRHLPSEQIAMLLTTLADSFGDRADRATGAAGRWLADHLLADLVREGEGEETIDERAIRSFTLGETATGESFSWEGLSYVVDRRGPVVRVLDEMPAGPQFADVVRLEGACSRLSRPMTTVDELRVPLAVLRSLEPAVRSISGTDTRAPDVRRYEASVASLARIVTPRDLPRVARQVDACWRTVDAVVDTVLPRWTYLLAAVPTDLSPAVLSDIASRHALGGSPRLGPTADWWLAAWRLPKEGSRGETGAVFHGALLDLDLALYPTQLRRLTLNEVPRSPQINEGDEHALIQWRILGDSVDAGTGRGVAEALRRGRSRLAELSRKGNDRDRLRSELSASAVDEWRTNLVVWLADQPGDLDEAVLLLSEILSLGRSDDAPPILPVPALVLDGCVCVRSEHVGAIEAFRGREGVIPTLTSDLWLRLIEHLTDLDLPPRLAAETLPFALQDWLDHVHQAWADDWEAVTNWPRQLRRERVEAYLLELVADRTLSAPPMVASTEGLRP